MKSVSNVILTSMMLLATMLYSCDKEIETSPVNVDKSKKATIKGYVYADLDQTNYGYELAPAGSKVIITMAYDELGLNTEGSLTDTVLLGNDGSFTYEIPTIADGVDVTAKVIDFVTDQKQEFDEQHTTKPTVFESVTFYFYDVKPNDFQIQEDKMDSYYTLGEIHDWYTVTGTIYLDSDLSAAGNEKLPSGTQVIFNCDGWSKSVTVAADGKYTVQVPSDEYIYMDYNFTVSGKLSGGTPVTFRYDDSESVGYIYSDTKDKNLYLGEGVTE